MHNQGGYYVSSNGQNHNYTVSQSGDLGHHLACVTLPIVTCAVCRGHDLQCIRDGGKPHTSDV